MDADPDRERDSRLALQARVQQGDGLDDPEAGADGAPRIVLAGDRVPEVHEHAVAEVLRHVAVKPANHAVTCLLIGANDIPEHLGIEPARQLRRSDEVAKHHGELPALRLCRTRRGTDRSGGVGGDGLGPDAPQRFGGPRGGRRERCATTITELAPGLHLDAAARTDVAKRRAALAAESRSVAVCCLAPGTLHSGGRLQFGELGRERGADNWRELSRVAWEGSRDLNVHLRPRPNTGSNLIGVRW